MRQRQSWHACGRRLTTRSASALALRAPAYRFPGEVIALTVCWYVPYRLTYEDALEWLAQCGITVDPGTVYDWVRALAHGAPPRFISAARGQGSQSHPVQDLRR